MRNKSRSCIYHWDRSISAAQESAFDSLTTFEVGFGGLPIDIRFNPGSFTSSMGEPLQFGMAAREYFKLNEYPMETRTFAQAFTSIWNIGLPPSVALSNQLSPEDLIPQATILFGQPKERSTLYNSTLGTPTPTYDDFIRYWVLASPLLPPPTVGRTTHVFARPPIRFSQPSWGPVSGFFSSPPPTLALVPISPLPSIDFILPAVKLIQPLMEYLKYRLPALNHNLLRPWVFALTTALPPLTAHWSNGVIIIKIEATLETGYADGSAASVAAVVRDIFSPAVAFIGGGTDPEKDDDADADVSSVDEIYEWMRMDTRGHLRVFVNVPSDPAATFITVDTASVTGISFRQNLLTIHNWCCDRYHLNWSIQLRICIKARNN
jgi:hypothetical protein